MVLSFWGNASALSLVRFDSMSTIICDLDGTLFNIDHRLHFIEGENKDWDGFFGACRYDSVILWCYELLKAMEAAGHKIAFVSGRDESTMGTTNRMISEMGFRGYTIFMRKHGDHSPDYQIKQNLYFEKLQDKVILFAIDDRQQVVDMWREMGITVLQCAKGDF